MLLTWSKTYLVLPELLLLTLYVLPIFTWVVDMVYDLPGFTCLPQSYKHELGTPTGGVASVQSLQVSLDRREPPTHHLMGRGPQWGAVTEVHTCNPVYKFISWNQTTTYICTRSCNWVTNDSLHLLISQKTTAVIKSQVYYLL